jgi:hypothetical protein
VRNIGERGGVSIFIVVFTALMVSVVTVSFTQIMIKVQQQATTNDLSQSAYDAAMAGVEDAKRALVGLRECENTTGCDANGIRAKLDRGCQSLDGLGVTFNNGEVKVGNDPLLNQAYTCVKVQLETDGYTSSMDDQQPIVIPLKAVDGYDHVRISWFTSDDFRKMKEVHEDVTDTGPRMPTSLASGLPQGTSGDNDAWPYSAPALVRAQLIQFPKGAINLDFLDRNFQSGARTLFLYPSFSMSGPSAFTFASDSRDSPNVPWMTNCRPDFTKGYACQADITIPNTPSVNSANREAYLEIETYYQPFTTINVEMLDGSSVTPVKFDAVQPQVDSTGRASDLFRRIKANVTLRNNGIPYQFPDAALSIDGNLCKTFFVTNHPEDYAKKLTETSGTSCEP